jgi:VWFA-related protein
MMGSLILLFLPSIAIAGSALHINQINIERFPDIVMYLTAIDERDNPIWGLDTNHFRVQEEGSKVETKEVLPLSGGNEPLFVVLAIDRSGSMKGQPIEDAKQAAKEFIREIMAIDQVGVIAFDDRVTVISTLTSDKNALNSAIDGIIVGRDTALNDAIMKSLELLSSVKGKRRAIVVLTDGKENRSKASREDVVQEAIRFGVPIITVGLGDKIDSDVLKSLAENSGGRPFFAKFSSELPDLYRVIAKQLINQYKVTLVSPKALDGKWHKIQIQVNAAQGKAETERVYLATLKSELNAKALMDYRRKGEWEYLAKIASIFLIPALLLAIVVTIYFRRKKAMRV